MPLLLGMLVGYLVVIHIWAIGGPIIALLNFLVGRFFIASVLMSISLYAGTGVWDDLVVTPDEYKVLLGFGLLLEGVKYGVKWWWSRGRKGPELELEEPTQVEFPWTHRRGRLEDDSMTLVRDRKGVYRPRW